MFILTGDNFYCLGISEARFIYAKGKTNWQLPGVCSGTAR